MLNTDQKHLGKVIFIWILCSNHSPLLKEVKEGTWKQKLRERYAEMLLTGLLYVASLACFLSKDHLHGMT